MDKQIVIDPGGELGGRAGVNVTVYPESYEVSNEDPIARRADYGRLITGKQSLQLSLKWTCQVSQTDYKKLWSLHNLVAQKIDRGQVPEIIIYDQFRQFSEFAPRTRGAVPNVAIETQGNLISYSPVLAGIFQMSVKEWMDCPVIECTFKESFIVTPEMAV